MVNNRTSQLNTDIVPLRDYFPSTNSGPRLTDALGSAVRDQLTSPTGDITYARAYDPYGVVTSTAGAAQTSYGYTGEFTSNEMVYLRARQYAPGMGRFLTRDTWGGSYGQPLTLNRWNYTTANPINLIDPSGRISGKESIQARIITEALRIDYNVDIFIDWGYMDWLPGAIHGIPAPNLRCNDWVYGNWRNLQELEWVRNGVHRLAMKMGGPTKFKSAMKNRPVEIVRVKTPPAGFTEKSGLALPYIPIYFMVNGLMLPDSAFDSLASREHRATYTTIHELGHVWDIRSGLSLSINMGLLLKNGPNGNTDNIMTCLLRLPDPAIRFACGLQYWQYNPTIEAAPGLTNELYADDSMAEDWAEAVANTVYPEYGNQWSDLTWRDIGPRRKLYVEMMIRDIP